VDLDPRGWASGAPGFVFVGCGRGFIGPDEERQYSAELSGIAVPGSELRNKE
jgi:hypothetical protein